MARRNFPGTALPIVMSAVVSVILFQNCTEGFSASSLATVAGTTKMSSTSRSAHVATTELISMPDLGSGINMKYACMNPDVDPSCGNIAKYVVGNPNHPELAGSPPAWNGAQWGSHSSLPAIPSWAGDHYSFGDGNKSLGLFPDGRVEIAINAYNEAGGQYVHYDLNHKWPHFLLERDLGDSGSLGTSIGLMSSLQFNFDARLLYNDPRISAGYNSNDHASTFLIYFTVANLKPGPGYGQIVWLGIPVYDDRFPEPPQRTMFDDGTKSMIYHVGYSSLAMQSMHSGNWVHLQGDLLPAAKAALAIAYDKGYVQSGNIFDYKIGGMNIGFEITGLNITTIQYQNLSLRATTSQSQALLRGEVFDANWYLQNYADLRNAFGADLEAATRHWLTNGVHEGRQGSRVFSAPQYIAMYSDLQAAFGTDYEAAIEHYINNGLREGRAGSSQIARSGFFGIPGLGAFFSNGIDAFCHVQNPDDFNNMSLGMTDASVLGRGTFPTDMRNDGDCGSPAQPEGFFGVPGGGVFYSNGSNAFCHVQNPDDLTIMRRGRRDPVRDRGGLPANMRNDGDCGSPPQPEGFFGAPDGIFYSNGSNAFCHVSTWDDFTTMYNARGIDDGIFQRGGLPGSMRRDGECVVRR